MEDKMIIKRKWFLRTWLGGTLAAMSLFSPFVSITAGAATPPKQLHDVTFSHDGKRLMFTLCGEKIPNGCAIHEYELTTGKLRYYTASENEVWCDARYSPQGDWIVFTITPVVNERRILEDTQLAIMRPDGKGLKRLTDSKGWKVAPSFSSSGKKIIYARAATMRKTGKTPAAGFDIYSYDLSSGQEQRLTNFKFFQISLPFYFGDDERFIFSAEYPRQFPDLRENDRDAIKQRREQLQQEHKEDQIYFMKKGDINFKPEPRFKINISLFHKINLIFLVLLLQLFTSLLNSVPIILSEIGKLSRVLGGENKALVVTKVKWERDLKKLKIRQSLFLTGTEII